MRLSPSRLPRYDADMARSAPIHDVPIGGDGIRLGQFLQVAGLVDSGAEAKEVIREGLVSVNGRVDLRRGRQLKTGEVVSFEGRRARVVLESEPEL